MNAQELSWDHLRTVLAIADANSLSGAARRLGVNHATVFRRLQAIESRLGVRLFERDRAGYTPTGAGEDIAQAARRIAAEVAGVERRIAGRDLLPSGTLRITTTDALLVGLLSPILTAFRRSFPDIALEIAVSPAVFSLAKREADIAIRPTGSPPENLVGRRIGSIEQAVYGAAADFTPDARCANLDEAEWVGPDERMGYGQLEAWMRGRGHDARCRYRVDAHLGMREAVASGVGVAVLPCYLADTDSRLVRLTPSLPDLATDLWLLTHPDLRRVARIRALMEFVVRQVRNEGGRLSPCH